MMTLSPPKVRPASLAAAICFAACAACAAPEHTLAPDASVEVDAGVMDGSVASDGGPGDAGAPLRILFVGNSYTYVNDLPGTVRALGAATPNAAVEVDSVVVGGATLQSLWTGTDAQARIATGTWNVVVLQGNSLEAVALPTTFYEHGRLFAGAARDAGARTAWYATWARRAGDGFYAAGYSTPAFMSRAIDNSYRTAADESGGILVRVGAAWQLALAEQPGVELYAADGSHPSPAGTLLTACVMLQAITGQAAVLPDPVPLGVDHATATALCALAPRVMCDGGSCECGYAAPAHSTYTALSALDAGCSASGERLGLSCNTAIQSACVSSACSRSSGFGPASSSGEDVDFTCVAGEVRHTSFAELQSFAAACDGIVERNGPDCSAAISRYCASTGALSGYGPNAIVGVDVIVTCVPPTDAQLIHLDYGRLGSLNPACDGVTQLWGAECNTAIDRFCRAQGYAGGFGPIGSAGVPLIPIMPLPGAGISADFVCVAW